MTVHHKGQQGKCHLRVAHYDLLILGKLPTVTLLMLQATKQQLRLN